MVHDAYIAAVSVDLDEVGCYNAIHGLPSPEGGVAHAIYDRALPRFERLFDALGIPATFFVVGKDLERSANRDTLVRLQRHGHELGNHSASHFYDLTRRSREVVAREIAEGTTAIADCTGTPPVGFRAPGYTVNRTLLAALSAAGYRYDSSVFPCPAYYAAKALAVTALRARRRPTHSIVDDPRVLAAPADPYRVGDPYWKLGDGILELPIGVTHGSSGRLPYIGTSLVLAGERGTRWLTEQMLGRPLVNLELHGIDLADANEDGLGFLAPYQPDLRRSLTAKQRALTAAITALRDAGYSFVTLAQAADHVS